jgi:hypothetical protein
MAYAPDARSLGDLFSDLTREITTLVRSELALARVEMSAKISRAAKHVGTIVIGGVIALAGVFTLAACIVLLLVRVGVAPWAAALLVGLALAGVGALLASRALTALRQEDLKPTETIETLKETTAWKRQTM